MIPVLLECDFCTQHFKFVNYIHLTSEQSALIFKNRNSIEIRKYMDDPKKISMTEHCSFLESLRCAKNKVYWACFYEDSLIGTFNLHPYEVGLYGEIGSYIFLVFQGKHLGTMMKKEACDYLLKTGAVKKLTAKIRKENSRNIHVNEKIGFKIANEDSVYVYMHYE